MRQSTRQHRFNAVCATILGVGLALSSAVASAAYISEYFNDYGTTTQNLELVAPGGGMGWAGNWSRPGAGTIGNYTDYVAGAAVIPTVTGYLATDNTIGVGNGAAGNATWGDQRYNSHRATGPLDGEIWLSVAYMLGTGFGDGRIALQFDTTSFAAAPNRIALMTGNSANDPQTFVYDGTSTSIGFTTWNPSLGTPYLLIAKIDIDYDGQNDRLTVWTHPGDVSSIAALGTPDFIGEGADVFGSSLDYFGIMVAQNSRLDAIRISNAPNAFSFVTTGIIPEPTTGLLLALGFGVALRRREAKRA